MEAVCSSSVCAAAIGTVRCISVRFLCLNPCEIWCPPPVSICSVDCRSRIYLFREPASSSSSCLFSCCGVLRGDYPCACCWDQWQLPCGFGLQILSSLRPLTHMAWRYSRDLRPWWRACCSQEWVHACAVPGLSGGAWASPWSPGDFYPQGWRFGRGMDNLLLEDKGWEWGETQNEPKTLNICGVC